jgi:hypothetical protein
LVVAEWVGVVKHLSKDYQHTDHATGRITTQASYHGEDGKVFDITSNTKEDFNRIAVRFNTFPELVDVLHAAIDNAWDNKEDRKNLKKLLKRVEKGY